MLWDRDMCKVSSTFLLPTCVLYSRYRQYCNRLNLHVQKLHKASNLADKLT